MDRQNRSDLLPLDDVTHSFDVVIRGYDRAQVHDVIDRLDGELRVALADKEASAARAAELATHLAAVQGETESLRRTAQSAGEPNFDSMGARISNMLKLAEEEAHDIRRIAEEDRTRSRSEVAAMTDESARMRSEAQDEARRVAEDAQASARRALEEAQESAAKAIADAQSHADEVTAHARTAIEQAENQSKTRMAKVEEEFDLAQKARRAEAARIEQERDQASRRDAKTRIEQAQQKSEEMIGVAERRVADLETHRAGIHTRLVQARELLAALPGLDAKAADTSPVAASGQSAPTKPGPPAQSAPATGKPATSPRQSPSSQNGSESSSNAAAPARSNTASWGRQAGASTPNNQQTQAIQLPREP